MTFNTSAKEEEQVPRGRTVFSTNDIGKFGISAGKRMKLDTSNEVGYLTLHHIQKGTQNELKTSR